MYAIVDIETTGGNHLTGKIIEVAIYKFDGQTITDEFVSLVNPEEPIPPFITKLTGINNDMVQNAPKFYEIAKNIIEITKDCIFVAHNVSFDYPYIKEEFLSLGYKYERKELCTVQMAKALLPGHDSYSLGKLSASLGIEIEGRHRAAGDALATVELFKLIYDQYKEDTLLKFIRKKANEILPEHISQDQINELPKKTGVYFFLNANNEIIYIGKSVNIRNRVYSHFREKKSRKIQQLKKEVRSFDYIEYGSELVALIEESKAIKIHQPKYNKALKRKQFPYGLFIDIKTDGYISLYIKTVKKGEEPVQLFKSMPSAKKLMQKWVEEYQLCAKLSGLEDANGSCFNHQIGKCNGACLNKEENSVYNLKVERFLKSLEYDSLNFLIHEKGRNQQEEVIIKIQNGKYTGWSFQNDTSQLSDEEIIDNIPKDLESRDIRLIVRSYLNKNFNIKKTNY